MRFSQKYSLTEERVLVTLRIPQFFLLQFRADLTEREEQTMRYEDKSQQRTMPRRLHLVGRFIARTSKIAA
jgi:hypothetical protein